MRELVHPEPAARAARALGVVEHEVRGLDVAVYEVVRRTRERLVEPLGFRLRDTLPDLDLHEAIADEQRRRDAGLDRLLVTPPDDEPVDDRVHVLHARFVELHLLRDVDWLAVDDEPAAPLLADLGEHEVEIFAIDLEYRR